MIQCEVCADDVSGPILDLGFHPLCDDLVPIGSSRAVVAYHQELQLCIGCLTVHQLHPVEKGVLFRSDYHYRASLTDDVKQGMSELVQQTIPRIRAPGRPVILDIGCNDGTLLATFKKSLDCLTVGVDPTDAILEHEGGIDYAYQDFFSIEVAQRIVDELGLPDVVTFTNVFAHIEDLGSLLEALKATLSPTTIVVIENHYLGSILEGGQFDTFYHEHPRTYSAKSFAAIADRLGMEVDSLEFPSRYGGNIRVTLAPRNGAPSVVGSAMTWPSEDEIVNQFVALQSQYEAWKFDALGTIDLLVKDSPLFGKALPGRAVMLISSLGLDVETMPVIFEKPSSPKVGFYVPGTKIEVRSDDDFHQYGPDRLMLWSWHIAREVANYMGDRGYTGQLWTPMPKMMLWRHLA